MSSFGAAIDVGIGLMECYLLLGLVGSSLQETVVGFINLRGKQLRKGLKGLLAHRIPANFEGDTLFERVSAHSLVNPRNDARFPSYVSARNFSMALIDVLRTSDVPMALLPDIQASIAKLPPGAAKTALEALLVRAGGNLDAFSTGVEHWFDDAMDRVSGVYKRISQTWMLVFGMSIAAIFNIDTISLTQSLWNDPTARQLMVAAATADVKSAETPSPDQDELNAVADRQDKLKAAAASQDKLKASAESLNTLPIPLGWNAKWVNVGLVDLIKKLLGLLITGIAVSLGAPFWFDLLQKFLNIRTSGPKPAKTPADE